MYTEWSSLGPQITANVNGSQQQSTLNKFNALISRDVTSALVKQLSGNLGITSNAEPSPFQTDQEVAWCMDVICFGLSLPLTDHETIKDCVNVYCEWLTCCTSPKVSVPKPIVDDPNVYTRKIISHLHNLFVPRQGEGNSATTEPAHIPNGHKTYFLTLCTLILLLDELIRFVECLISINLFIFFLFSLTKIQNPPAHKPNSPSLRVHKKSCFVKCFSRFVFTSLAISISRRSRYIINHVN